MQNIGFAWKGDYPNMERQQLNRGIFQTDPCDPCKYA